MTMTIKEVKRRGRPVPAKEMRARKSDAIKHMTGADAKKADKTYDVALNLVESGFLMAFDVDGELYFFSSEKN